MSEHNTRNTLVSLAGVAQRQILRGRKAEVLSAETNLASAFDKLYDKMLIAMQNVAKKTNKTNSEGEFQEDSSEVKDLAKKATEEGNKKTKEIMDNAADTGKTAQSLTKGFSKSEEGEDGFFQELAIPCKDENCKKANREMSCLFHEDAFLEYSNLQGFGPISCTNTILVEEGEKANQFKFARGVNQVRVSPAYDGRPIIQDYSCGKLMVRVREFATDNLSLGREHETTIKPAAKPDAEEEEAVEEGGEEEEAGEEAAEAAELEKIAQIHEKVTLDITTSGCVVAEKRQSKMTEAQKLKFQRFEECLKGPIKSKTTTDIATSTTYTSKDELQELQVYQPRLQPVIHKVMKIGCGSAKLVLNKCVFVRKVTRTVTRGDGKPVVDEFLEPVYAAICPKIYDKDKAKTDKGSDCPPAEKPKQVQGDGGRPPYLHFIYLTMVMGEPVMKILTDRYMNCRTILEQIVEEHTLNTRSIMLDADVDETELPEGEEGEEKVAKKEEPQPQMIPLLDRGIAAKFRYSDGRVIVEQKEYRNGNSLAHSIINLNDIVEKETKNVRYKSLSEKNPSSEKRKRMFTLEKSSNEGLVTRKVLTRTLGKVTVREEIEEPCLNAFVQWLLERPESAKISSKDTVLVSPEMNFIVMTTYSLRTRESADEAFNARRKRVYCKFSLVHCKFTELAAYKEYHSVKSLKDNFSKLDHAQWSNLYELSADMKTVQSCKMTTEDLILASFAKNADSQGKEILKFPLYTPEGDLVSEVEMKSSVVDKNKEKKAKRDSGAAKPPPAFLFCKPHYSKDFESQLIASALHIEETPLMKVTNRFAVISPTKIIQVTEEEPNLLSILSHRAIKESPTQKLTVRAPSKEVISRLFPKPHCQQVTRSKSEGIHEATCLFHNFGLFGIKSKVTIQERGVGLDDITICRAENIKIVCAFCQNCPNAHVLSMNSDLLSDAAVFTLPREKISYLDIQIGMQWMREATQGCERSAKDNIINRFKHKVQRCMNHMPKQMAEEDPKLEEKEETEKVDDTSLLYETQ